MGKQYYMHTLEGKPAFFSEPDGKVCFMNSAYSRNCNYLVLTLRQLREEQQKSVRTVQLNDETLGFTLKEYGYKRVYLPDA